MFDTFLYRFLTGLIHKVLSHVRKLEKGIARSREASLGKVRARPREASLGMGEGKTL